MSIFRLFFLNLGVGSDSYSSTFPTYKVLKYLFFSHKSFQPNKFDVWVFPRIGVPGIGVLYPQIIQVVTLQYWNKNERFVQSAHSRLDKN